MTYVMYVQNIKLLIIMAPHMAQLAIMTHPIVLGAINVQSVSIVECPTLCVVVHSAVGHNSSASFPTVQIYEQCALSFPF